VLRSNQPRSLIVVLSIAFPMTCFGLASALIPPRAPADEAVPDSDSAPAPACTDCAKLVIQSSDDPVTWLANLRAAQTENDARVQTYLAQAHDDNLRELSRWHGTKTFLPEGLPERDRDLFGTMAARFAADSTVPEPRMNEFGTYFKQESEFKCVGWHLQVSSVVADGDGWLVQVHVRPHLMRSAGRAVFNPRTSFETWRALADGGLQFVKSEAYGLNIVMVD
jgi:hypothetical protein